MKRASLSGVSWGKTAVFAKVHQITAVQGQLGKLPASLIALCAGQC
jgi:hypothetical protein